MKTLLIILIKILVLSVNAQNYTLVKGNFNTSGGFQQNSFYSTQAALGEYVQGNIISESFDGYLGFLFPLTDQSPPIITSIDDVPNDQGRKVQIIWDKCAYDDAYDMNKYYSIWRFDEDFGEQNLVGNSNKTFAEKSHSHTFSEPLLVIEQFRIDPLQTYFWENGREIWTFVDEVPALQIDQYSYISSTLLDSSAFDSNPSIFKIVFHDEYQYYESENESGYSIDNIVPDVTSTIITLEGNNFQLNWNEVSTGTFEGNSYEEINGIWYRIYSSDNPDFTCDQSNLIDTVTNTSFSNPMNIGESRFFKIVVSDKP